jgi:hypothetical protein
VTTTYEIENRTWATTIVTKPRVTPSITNSDSNETPSTISGVAIGRKTKTLSALRPRIR